VRGRLWRDERLYLLQQALFPGPQCQDLLLVAGRPFFLQSVDFPLNGSALAVEPHAPERADALSGVAGSLFVSANFLDQLDFLTV
jgi:hypothetical protein